MKRPIEDLKSEILEHSRDRIFKEMRHRTTGDIYIFCHVGYRESDMTLEFNYCPKDNRVVYFSRPIEELDRFEFI